MCEGSSFTCMISFQPYQALSGQHQLAVLYHELAGAEMCKGAFLRMYHHRVAGQGLGWALRWLQSPSSFPSSCQFTLAVGNALRHPWLFRSPGERRWLKSLPGRLCFPDQTPFLAQALGHAKQ